MANKFHDNLIVSSSPHIVTESDTTRLMGSVLLALAPAWIASIYIFGLRALLLSVVCVAASVLFEYIYNAITHKKQTVGDLSAALTGLLIAFNVPANFPFWQATIGCLFAIVVVKQLFGGIGRNLFNPAACGKLLLVLFFHRTMTNFSGGGYGSDTPLMVLSKGGTIDLSQMLLGNVPGLRCSG